MSVVSGCMAGHPVSFRHRLAAAWLLPCLCALSLLSGCGGGEDYVSSVPPPTTPGTGTTTTTTTDEFPMVVNLRGATLRKTDLWMYEWVNQTTGTGHYATHYLSDVDATQKNHVQRVFFSDDQSYQTRSYSPANVLVQTAHDSTLCRSGQSSSPYPGRPWTLGTTWTQIWTESCLAGTVATTTNHAITGRIVSSSEPLTLGLFSQSGTLSGSSVRRTFDAVKYTATRTQATSAGAWVYTDTCWHDKVQDRTIQCDTQASYTPAGSSTPQVVHDITQRLACVREVRTKSPVLLTDGISSVAMYAGRWGFKLQTTGGVVTCPVLTVGLTGQVSGNCIKLATFDGGTQPVPFAVSGFIARGAITTQAVGQAPVTRTIDALTVVADTGANVLTLTGEMVSPLSAKGTWLGETGTTGDWVAQRL